MWLAPVQCSPAIVSKYKYRVAALMRSRPQYIEVRSSTWFIFWFGYEVWQSKSYLIRSIDDKDQNLSGNSTALSWVSRTPLYHSLSSWHAPVYKLSDPLHPYEKQLQSAVPYSAHFERQTVRNDSSYLYTIGLVVSDANQVWITWTIIMYMHVVLHKTVVLMPLSKTAAFTVVYPALHFCPILPFVEGTKWSLLWEVKGKWNCPKKRSVLCCWFSY